MPTTGTDASIVLVLAPVAGPLGMIFVGRISAMGTFTV